MTTAEGGVVTTPHREAADAVRRLRNQGQLHGSATLIGGSGGLSEFGAALGEAQLNHRDEWLKGQAAVFARYRAALDQSPFATVQGVPDGGRASGYKFIALAATPLAREELRAHLARHGVSLPAASTRASCTTTRGFAVTSRRNPACSRRRWTSPPGTSACPRGQASPGRSRTA